MSLTVVVPTYNERENIETVIERLQSVFQENGIDGRIVVVDDSSPDGTADVVRGLDWDNLELHVRERKEGLGAAYKFAFARCDTDYVMEMDADLSHDPDELPRFLEKLEEGYDLVVGSRYIEGGVRDDPFYRRIFPIIGNFLYQTVLGFPVKDTTSGYRAFRREALEEIEMESLPDDFAFQSAMVFRFMEKGFKIGEVPITFRDRRAGEAKYSTRDLLSNALLLVKLFFRRINPF